MKFFLNFLVTFLLLISLDFTLIGRHHSNALNTDCIIIQSRIKENGTHPFHGLLQSSTQLKEGNLFSLVSENSLGDALKSCYFSTSTVALIVFVSFENELMGVIEKISEDVRQYRRAKRESNCKMFLLSVFQRNTASYTLPNDLFTSLPSPFPFDISSDFYLLFGEKDSSIQQLSILELYTVKDRLFVQPVENQYQSNNDPLDFIHNFLFHMKPTKTLRRQNLQGVQVVAASFLNKEDENYDMYEIKIGTDLNGEDYYESGLSVSILRDIRTAANFTEKMLKVYINGDNYFESSFTSEQVQFDINLYHLGITKNRTTVAQPLLPTFFDGVHAIFTQPSDKSSRNIYGKPFTYEMWLTLLSAWTLIFLCCNLFLYLHSRNIIQSSITPCTFQVKHVDVESEISKEVVVHPYIPFETFLWCIGTICQQGWYKLPKPTPIRLILITGLFLSVTCLAAFIGKLTSELYDVSKPIKSLKDLLEYTEKIYLIASSDTSFDLRD